MVEPSYKPLAPKDAIAYFRSKGLEPSFAWQDVWQQEHAKAFTVAKMFNRDLLEATRLIIDEMRLSEGYSSEAVAKVLAEKWQAEGWWGRQKMTDPQTGEERLVQLGSRRRSRTVVNMNARTSYAHGQWQRIERTKSTFPYLMYDAIDDGVTRAHHRAWDKTCLPVDDPWWDTHYPPCGWNCRCHALQVNVRMAAKLGAVIGQRPPEFEPVTYVNPRTGEVTQIERGISPGFNYNVGKAPLRPLSPAPATVRPGRPSVPAAEAKEATKDFLKPFSAEGKGRIVRDRDGWPLAITDGLFIDAKGYPVVPRPDLIHELPAVSQALLKPDRAEWIWARDMRPEAEVARLIEDVVDMAQTSSTPRRVVTASVSVPFEALAKTHGVDLRGYDHELTTDAVRHVLKNHGNAVTEAARGQIAVSAVDFRMIPDIVSAPEAVIFGAREIVYMARRSDAWFIYVEERLSRQKSSTAKTLYKKPVAQDVQSVISAVLPNVRNDDGFAATIVDLTGQNNRWRSYARQQLVRRYTKTLDDRRITVDFSRDLWTYDVQPLTDPLPRK